MGIESATTGRASRNRIGASTRGSAPWSDLAIHVCRGRNFLVPPRLARLVGLPIGRVAADGSSERTDDGRVVRDFKLEPTTREV